MQKNVVKIVNSEGSKHFFNANHGLLIFVCVIYFVLQNKIAFVGTKMRGVNYILKIIK